MKRFLALAFGLLIGLMPAAPALAADFNITTSPLPILLSVKPGQSTSTKIRVQNSGTKATTFRVDLKKFKASGDNGKPEIQDAAPSDDYFKWVSFSSNSFSAEPGVWNEITMTIKTPSTAAFGYYYAVVFSGTGDVAPKVSAPGSQVKGGTAVLVLLDAQAKGEKKELSIAHFSASHKLYEYLPADFSVSVRNSGNIHLAPAGSIFITRGSKTISTLDLNPGGGNVLPGSQRTFAASWSDGFPVFMPKIVNGQIVSDKNSKPVKQLSWNFAHANRLRFGHYTAHLLMTYDNGLRDVPVEGDVSFWVVPWGLILLVIAIPLIPSLMVYFLMRWRYNRKAGGKRQ